MGRKSKIVTDDDPTERELAAAERYGKRLEKRWKDDIEELRKQLRHEDDDEEDEA